MSLIAAFLWNKSPRCSISTMIINNQNMAFLLPPAIDYLPKGFCVFRKNAKMIIKHFFDQIIRLKKLTKEPIVIEFKIVFYAHDIPYLIPAKESMFVYKTFNKYLSKAKKQAKQFKVNPQLRRRLSGVQLKRFKKELRNLHLVSQTRETNFEYHLWTVALHATNATYKTKLQQTKKKLVDAMWEEAI